MYIQDKSRMESVLKPCAGFWEALELEPERCPILCLAGAGGKTTAMYRLAEEAAARGLRVCVTTTTRIWCPGDERRVLLLERRAEELKGKCLPGQVLTAGVPAEPGKLKGLSPEETAGLLEFCDLLLIEADGSKRFPFKVPAAWEPVILKEARAVVAVAGLTALGKPAGEVCFRKEQAQRAFGIRPEEPVPPRLMARVLADQNGQRKGVGQREYRILLNQADSESGLLLACETAACLRQMGERHCAVSGLYGEQRRFWRVETA